MVTVVERAPVLADVGAGISPHANGLRALDALGVGEAVRAAARPQYTEGTRTPGGGWLARMDGAALERELGTPIVGIPSPGGTPGRGDTDTSAGERR